MTKRILSLLAITIIILSIATGCGSITKSEATMSALADVKASEQKMGGKPEQGKQKVSVNFSTAETASDTANTVEAVEAPNGDASTAFTLTDSGTAVNTVPNEILAQRKVIRNANVTVEVDDFNVAYGKIKTLINGFGYIQESNISKDKVYVDSKEKLLTKGIIVVRIDKDKFDDVISGIKGLGLLVEENIKSDDVTDKFFDTESRLRLLKYEETRLEQYLNKINDPDTIFKTESRLTDIRHEIESLTGTLNKWENLVQLSTVTINMREKYPTSDATVKQKTYLDRLFGSFAESFKSVVAFCGETLIFIVQILPALILLGILWLIGLGIYRKHFKKRVKPSEKNDNNDLQM